MPDSWKADNDDLLVGDVMLGSIDSSQYLDIAAREINSRLGEMYVLPIPDDIPDHQSGALKQIHANIATGRLLLAESAGSEDEDGHAYGLYLVAEGYRELDRVGTVYELGGSAVRISTAGEDRRPSIESADTTSPFDTFYDQVYGGNPGYVDWSSS